ncbi:M48 family metallopeptidase [Candidatus Woesearchaeota archaeon]|nr:M48 family metallopeptidase [Candidatus Woesearchaeota archaeon]
MNLIQEAYFRLFPDREFPYDAELNYNLRLSDFNSNVRLYGNKLSLNLNLQWKDIDDEIKIGLIQTLLLKILKQKKNTPNIELYHNFIKNIPILTPKTETDNVLEASFQRVNRQFFSNQIEPPNLTWGTDSRTKLASYNFHRDMISVSAAFKTASERVLDYLMYHELLHKWQKFRHKNGRSFYHTSEFREAEREYPQQKEVEEEIKRIIKRPASKKSLFGWLIN